MNEIHEMITKFGPYMRAASVTTCPEAQFAVMEIISKSLVNRINIDPFLVRNAVSITFMFDFESYRKDQLKCRTPF